MSETERQLLGSLAGANADLDSLREEVDRLRNQITANNSERNVGNPLGGPVRTEIAPGLLPIGPYKQDVDATFSLEFTLWLSEELLRIRKMTFHLTPKPTRLASGIAASSGTLTSDASADVVNVESAGHVHIWASFVSSTPSAGSTTVSGAVTTPTGQPSATAQSPAALHTHNENNVLGGPTNVENTGAAVPTITHTHAITIAANQSVVAFANFEKWGTFDSTGTAGATYAFDFIGISGHASSFYTAISGDTPTSVSTPDHTHDIDGHTHTITLSISELGMADDLEILIDGVNRTTLLGGPWTAASDIVLDPNLLQAVGFVDVRLNPVVGPHTIEITSSAQGAVEVVGDYSVVIKAVQ